MGNDERTPLSREELAAESGTALPDKEVMSLLDLNADLNAALDLAAPIDLAVAANANVAAPIDASVGANVLSVDSQAGAVAHQTVGIEQGISGDAIAHAPQVSAIDQSGADSGATDAGGSTDTGGTDAGTTAPTDGTSTSTGSALDGNLLNVDVNAAIDAKLAAPVAGAVAANANVAAPIDASVSANVGSVGSDATAVADQTALVDQHLDGVTADATADQHSDLKQ
jgi:hypothetical protein